MNPDTGAVYPDLESAIAAGEDPEDIVEVKREIQRLSDEMERLREDRDYWLYEAHGTNGMQAEIDRLRAAIRKFTESVDPDNDDDRTCRDGCRWCVECGIALATLSASIGDSP